MNLIICSIGKVILLLVAMNISLYGEVYELNYMFHREGNLIACINEYIIVWEVYGRNYMFHREGNLIACSNEYIIVWGGI